MFSLNTLYTNTLAAANRATDHLGPLSSLADRLADRVLPQAFAKAGCKCPYLCRKWIVCGPCGDMWQSCATYCERCTGKPCYQVCYCTSDVCV